MSRTRRTVLALAAVTAGATVLVTVPAGADQTLRLTTIASGNTDLDLAPGEPGPGDTQVLHDEVRERDGGRVGTSEGSCTVTGFSETSLSAYCSVTVLFDDGSSLTLQGGFDEDPAVGPTEFRWAVTGGTGRHRGASGEATGTFREEQVDGFDAVDLEIRFR
ncbi:dirigent protein [Geodermatophilus sp. SYSU D00815]